MPERVRAESSATAKVTAPAIVITTSLGSSMEEDNPPIDEGRSTAQPPKLRTEAEGQQRQDPLALQRQSTISSSVPVPAAMERYKHVDALRDATAGAIAGAVAKTAVAPVERVKLLMQLQNSLPEGERGGAVGTAPAGGRRSSAWRVARNVYRTQGVLAFWRGNTPNVLRQAGTAALNFMLMDHYKVAVRPLMEYTLRLPSKRTPEQRTRRRRVLSSFLSGGLAGGTTTTVLYPAEFLRTRLAMDVGATAETRKYPRGMRDVLCSTLKSDGVRGLYQGYGIALAGVVLYRALHLGGYDAVKNELLIYRGDDDHGRRPDLSMTERFVAAQTVSLVAGTMCYPIDSVRRRLMMQAGLPPEERLYRNSVDCFRKVWTKEGARGFYLGIGPNLVRSFGGALLLVGYDVFKGMIY